MQAHYLLKVLSGPQMGGEMLLEEGVYRIGSQPHDDIILSDATVGEHHIMLSVGPHHLEMEGGEGVFLEGGKTPNQPHTLAPFQIFSLGAVHMAIGPCDEAWPVLVPPTLNIEEPEPTVEVPRQKRFTTARLGLALLLLVPALLGISLIDAGDRKQEPPSHILNATERLTNLIESGGYAELEIIDEGSVPTIVGYVPDGATRSRLEKELAAAQIEAHVNVVRHDQMLLAAQRTLEAFNLHLDLSIDLGGTLILSGFCADANRLEQGLAVLASDVAGLRQYDNKVLTGAAALARTRAVLLANQLELESAHHEDKIYLKGVLDAEQQELLGKVLAELAAEFGPKPRLVTQLREPHTPVIVAQAKETRPPTIELDVLAANIGSVRYLKLMDGRTLFEGSRLESGYQISRITANAVVLRYRDQEYHYPLGERP